MSSWMPTPVTELLAVPGVRPLAVFIVASILAVILRRVTEAALRARVAADDEDKQAILDQLVRPLTALLVLFGGWIALGAADMEDAWRDALRSLVASAAVLVAARAALGGLRVALERAEKRPPDTRRVLHAETAPLFDIGGKVTLLLLSGWLLLLAWRVDVTAWLASAGVVGVVVGLAAQESLSNLLAGATILADAPYHVGDMIMLADGTRGTVRDIGLRSTRIVTLDSIEIIIPNKEMATTRIVNVSEGPIDLERAGVNVQVAYDSDLDRVAEILRSIVPRLPADVFDPARVDASVRFRSFDDSGITVRLFFHVRPELRDIAVDLAIREIHRTFRAEGIHIPFPQVDVHVPPGTQVAFATLPHPNRQIGARDATNDDRRPR